MSSTWCPIPWNFQAVRSNGDVRVCCQANITKNKGVLRKHDGSSYNAGSDDLDEARNSPLIRQIRSLMLRGEWSEECLRCRTEEDSGLVSRRSYEHERWPNFRMEDVIGATADDGTIDTGRLPVVYYDLRFGNFCNLACRMCGPQDSTGWYDDWQRMENQDWFEDSHGIERMRRENGKLVSDSYNWHDSENFWRQIEANAGRIQHVYMAGGEPLLIERHYEFLERCVESGAARNMLVEYNTNMTTVPTRVLTLWKSFKQVQIGASIDGMGGVFEYQRHPAVWDKVLRNLYKVDDGPDNIMAWLAYTVTAYNVLHMPLFMRWKLQESGFRKFNNTLRRPILTHHVAHRPHYLNIKVLPPDIKKEVVARFDDLLEHVLETGYPEQVYDQAKSIRDSVVNYMMSEDRYESGWPAFVDYTTRLDAIRNQDIRDVVPELREYL